LLLFPLRVKVNLKVDRKACPEVGLEVEFSCTQFFSALSWSLWDSILVSVVKGLKVRVTFIVLYKVNLKVDRKASPEVSLEVEVGCTLFISAVSGSFWDSFLDSEVIGLKVKVM
jgi:hypothetical protein